MKGQPIYTQVQVDRLLSMPKVVQWDAWSRRLHGRETNGERYMKIEVQPTDVNNLTEFRIEARHRIDGRVKTSFNFFAQVLGRKGHAVCRYDVQDQKHTNDPRWFEPRWVNRLVAHRHVYNELAVREGHAWDACAAPIHMGDVGTVQQRIDRTARIFVDELKIEIHDPEVLGRLFEDL